MGDEGKKEISPGGSSILRHQARDRAWQPPAESTGMEEIEQHVSRYFGEAKTVLHEIVSDKIHLDVHVIPPAPERDHWTLFTTGMSDRPMTTPEGAEDDRFAELLLFLPRDWKVGIEPLAVTPPTDGPDTERWYWPIRWLKTLARLPHDYDTWLGFGHTVPNGDPPEPFAADTKLCGWMLLPPIGVPAEGRVIALADGRKVNLFVIHALYDEEMTLKLAKGVDGLLDAFERARVSETLRIDRPSSVRRKLFGLF